MCVGEGGGGHFHILSSWVDICLHTEFQLPKMCESKFVLDSHVQHEQDSFNDFLVVMIQ